MLENVQQQTIFPLIQSTIAPGTLVHTDEYDIYTRLRAWGYAHKTVCHSHGEYARDEDGDGCLLYTSPSPRDGLLSRMPSSA